MRQRVRILAVVALAAFTAVGPGCFVLDELDAGMAEMQQHSKKKKKGAPAEAEPAAAPKSGSTKPDARAALADWWKKARTPASGPREGEEAADIVACRIGEATRYTTRTDCELQGGRF